MKILVKWVVYSRFVWHEDEMKAVQVIGSEANYIISLCNNVWWKKAQPMDNFIQRTQGRLQSSCSE